MKVIEQCTCTQKDKDKKPETKEQIKILTKCLYDIIRGASSNLLSHFNTNLPTYNADSIENSS
jgi:hypothetical protein